MKKVISITFTIFTLVILFISILSFFHSSFFGFRIYKVKTGSMEPSIHALDTILVKKSDSYKKNDIVTYKNSENEYVTHRIISIDDDKVITKGDANNVEDSPIHEKNIIGKVIFKVSMFGFIGYLLNKPTIWILVFIIGIIMILVIPDRERNENSETGKNKEIKNKNN